MNLRVIIFIIAIFSNLPIAIADISDHQSSSVVVGQTDFDDSTSPSFYQTGVNNGPNDHGFNSHSFRNGQMALDEIRHRLFVADYSNGRILVFNLNSDNTFEDYKADNILGQSDFNSVVNTTFFTAGTIYAASGLAYDSSNDRLFASDSTNNRVVVFDTSTIVDGEDPINVLGQTSLTGSTAATTQSGLKAPGELVFDSTNNLLYVADLGNNRIMIFDVTTITNGEDAINVLGQSDFVTASGGITQSTFGQLSGLAVDEASDLLYVTDGTVDRVLVFAVDTITNGENAVGILGLTSYTTLGGGTTDSTFDFATGVAVDSAGDRLFVSDRNNRRVMVFDVATLTDGESATHVLGQSDFTSIDATASQSTMDGPTGLLFSNDQLFVFDTGADRILHYTDVSTSNISNGMLADDSLGQTVSDVTAPSFTQTGANDGPSNRGFWGVEDVLVDTSNHRLFVVDSTNGRIFRIDPSQRFQPSLPFQTPNEMYFALPLFRNLVPTQGNQLHEGG